MDISYFDLEQILHYKDISEHLKKAPHILKDIYGRTLSSNQLDKLKEMEEIPISYSGHTYGSICSDKENIKFLLRLVLGEIISNLEKLQRQHLIATEELLTYDIEKLFELGQNPKISLEFILESFLVTLKSYVPFEKGSIYVENTKKELTGLALINGTGDFSLISENTKNLGIDTLGGVCFTNQKIYIVTNPSQDPMYKKRENDKDNDIPKNLACFPLHYYEYSLGVLNISDLLTKEWSPFYIDIISRLMVCLNHILYQNQVKDYLSESDQATNNFKFYVSKNLFNSITTDSHSDFEISQKKHAVCLFCDIRSFTSISEKVSPSDLIKLLNIYFDELTPIIEESGGTIDKYVGDMIAAFWNAPKTIADPELLAVQAAIKMQRTMVQKVVPEWNKAGVRHIGIGIGIHSGSLIVGNIGSQGFNDYTVIGEVPKKANWLESKARPAEIWLSEEVFKKVKAKLPAPARKEMIHKYKGVEQNIFVFKPSDYPDYTKK